MDKVPPSGPPVAHRPRSGELTRARAPSEGGSSGPDRPWPFASRPRRSEDVDPARGSLDLYFRYGPASHSGLPGELSPKPGRRRHARARLAASGRAVRGFFEGFVTGPRDGLRRVEVEFHREEQMCGDLGAKRAWRPAFKIMAIVHGVVVGPFKRSSESARLTYRYHLRPDFRHPGRHSERHGGPAPLQEEVEIAPGGGRPRR